MRQHASRYLALIKRGERVKVSDRGRPVAMLVPVLSDRWEDLLATGHITPPADSADVADEEPGDYDFDAHATLEAMRAEER